LIVCHGICVATTLNDSVKNLCARRLPERPMRRL
jgi:hypothetical protein